MHDRKQEWQGAALHVAIRDIVRERYTPDVAPPCACGLPMYRIALGQWGVSGWLCASLEVDPERAAHLRPRQAADAPPLPHPGHEDECRIHWLHDGDPEVLTVLDTLGALLVAQAVELGRLQVALRQRRQEEFTNLRAAWRRGRGLR